MTKIGLLFLGFLKFILDTTIKPVIRLCFRLYYRKIDTLKPLPKCKSDLLLMPANKLALKIRNREITSLELVTVFIERIKEIQPLVNCVVNSCFDKAIEEAKTVDRILSSTIIAEQYSEENAPLLGVPFSCKECIYVKNMPNTSGLISRRDFIAPQDADVVRNMRQAGAILTCLTNVSEACMWLESSNYLFGTTCNPYNLSRIVGGSSGGEGAVVSSAASVIGIGSDIGGSIRMPAFFNGVYGHKPSPNLISNDYQHPPATGLQEPMLGIGPICRYASDLRVLFKIFVGQKYQELEQNFETNINLKKLKYYYIRDLQGNLLVTEPSRESRNALNKAIQFIETHLDLKVNEIKLNKFKSSFQIWASMMNNGIQSSNTFSKLLTNGNGEINPFVELLKSIFCLQKSHTLPAISLAITERLPTSNPIHHIEMGNQLKKEIQQIIGDDGIILFPSFPVVAPYHNQALLTNSLDFIYYGIINSLGFPSTQIPLGLSEDGLPTGIQIIANNRLDHLTIRLAEYFESNLVGWTPPF